MAKPTKPVVCLSTFGDSSAAPQPGALHEALGDASSAWSELARRVAESYPPIVEQWSFAGARYGWSMRLRRGERVVLYLIPQRGRFLVGLVLGGRAVAEAARLDLPATVRQALAEAPRYAEGTGLRLPVTCREDLGAIGELTALKMAAAAK